MVLVCLPSSWVTAAMPLLPLKPDTHLSLCSVSRVTISTVMFT